jgi:transposase-like protein
MDEREFATWLSEMHRLSARQRAAALVRLQDLEGAATTFEPEQASSQAEAKVSGKSASRSKRSSSPAALGEIGPAKVESVGCPHCGGGESVGWGRAHDLERYRCKACRRTFNAATKTPVARLRKKERWFSHAAAMIEGVSLAKAADRCGVHPLHGVSLASSLPFRAGARQTAALERDRRNRRDLHPRILQGAALRSAPSGAQTRRQGQVIPASRQRC